MNSSWSFTKLSCPYTLKVINWYTCLVSNYNIIMDRKPDQCCRFLLSLEILIQLQTNDGWNIKAIMVSYITLRSTIKFLRFRLYTLSSTIVSIYYLQSDSRKILGNCHHHFHQKKIFHSHHFHFQTMQTIT